MTRDKKDQLRVLRAVGASACLLLLAACAGTSPPPAAPAPSQSGRYAIEHDIPMLEPFDLAQVKPVIPRKETRTIAGNKSPYRINGVTYRVMGTEEGYSATGLASWYGRKFHGHATSNGEIYDMFQLSAAHRSLPIPSYVKVTNLANGRSLLLRVNDRGPFHEDRIIDLSYAAASLLGYAEQGTARVRVEAVVPGREEPALLASNGWWLPSAARLAAAPATVSTAAPTTVAAAASAPVSGTQALTALAAAPLPPLTASANDGDYLQVGAFANLESARGLLSKLTALTGLPARIHSEPGAGSPTPLHRVRLGPLNETVDLDSIIRVIVDANLGTPFRVPR